MVTDKQLPEIDMHLFYGKCPDCGQKFWSYAAKAMGYPMHYASVHLGIPVFRRVGS